MPILHFFYLALLITVSLAFPTPASAQNTNIAEIFENILKTQEEKLAENGINLSRAGNIEIEKTDEYQALTLPELTLQYQSGNKIKLGLIAINATPQEDVWKMSIALPTPILYLDAQDNVLAQLDIGQQQMNAVWNLNTKKITNITGTYSDLVLTSAEQERTLKITKLLLSSKIQGNQRQIQTQINGISASNLQNKEILSLEKLSLLLQQKNKEDNQDLINQNLKASYQGQHYKLENTVEANLIPQEFETNITLDNFPLKEVWRLGKQAFEARGKNTGMQQLVMLQALMTLPAVLSAASTSLQIEDTTLTHAEYSSNITGNIKSQTGDTLSASGIIEITTHKLDPLIQKILHLLKDEEREIIKSYKTLMKRLELLNNLSEEITVEEETSKKKLVLKLTPEGKFFINDKEAPGLLFTEEEEEETSKQIGQD
ncbi:MAG: hypothetical protein MRY79_06010 [Alphaproteobacteria bacterium]|nr:hypothetical protein [Alphaproteobacteria bacterium]